MPTIDARTRVCAVIGHPIGHSLSPQIHNAAFEELGLPFVYVAHDVAPGTVARALDGVRVLGYRGLSVTIPHKVDAMLAVDEVDETARCIGCINTVVNEGARLVGYNSDGLGALGALREAGADPRGKNVLVLGSGGAARAVSMTVAREAPPARMTILGVEADQLAELVADVRRRSAAEVAGAALEDGTLRESLASADIVLHCSPVGMAPNVDASVVPADAFRAGLVVFDAVYNPRRTRLLREAESAGCRVVPGLEMFLGQAYVQFELWTGQRAPREVMRRIVEERL